MASPMSTHGVPPMRSRVQNEKPLSLPSTGEGDEHPELGLLRQQPDLEPARRRSAQMSAISASSASVELRAVLGLDLDRHVAVAPGVSGSTGRRPVASPGSRSRRRCHSATPPGRFRLTLVRPSALPERARLQQRRRRARAAPAARRPGRWQVDANCVGQPQHLPVAEVEEHLRLAGMLAEQALQPCRCSVLAQARLGAGVIRSGGAVGDALEARRSRMPMSLGVSSRLSTRPFTHTTASSASLWPVLGHRLREDHHLDGGLQVLEREDRHQVALLRPLALQVGDDAADRRRWRRRRARASSATVHVGPRRRARLGAHQRMVAHVEAEHLLLERQPLALVELDVGDRSPARRSRRRPFGARRTGRTAPRPPCAGGRRSGR